MKRHSRDLVKEALLAEIEKREFQKMIKTLPSACLVGLIIYCFIVFWHSPTQTEIYIFGSLRIAAIVGLLVIIFVYFKRNFFQRRTE